MPASFAFTLISTSTGATVPATAPFGAVAGADAVRDFRLDSVTGDLVLNEGDLQVISGAEGVASDIASRLQTFRGECFLDLGLGLPYFEEILGKHPLPRVEEIFRAAILETPGVAGIEAFTLQRTGRSLSLAFRVSTDFATIIDATLNLEN